MKIRIHIDRMVLDGFAITAGQRGQLQAAVESELAHLIAASDSVGTDTGDQDGDVEPRSGRTIRFLPHQSEAVPSATAGPFNPPNGSSPRQLGQHIARSIHGGIGKSQ
jgi:hypothetical protein